MPINYFDPRLLTGIISKRPVKYDFFTGLFLPQAPAAVEHFDIHIHSRGVSMLPAISNESAGTMRQSSSTEVASLRAPRFRVKRLFKAADRLKLRAGMTPYDTLINPVELAISEDMDAHREELDFMLEIMCAQAAVHGKIDLYDVIEGQTVKTFTVDFRRPSKHTVALAAADKWTAKDSKLQEQMDEWDALIQEDTGFSASDLILGKNAYAAFRKHADVRDDLDIRRLDLGGLAPRVSQKFRGTWYGLNIWTLSGTYADLSGTVRHYMPTDSALLVAKDAANVIEFGQPIDNQCTGPARIFAKTFEQEDPSGTFTIAESRPLPWTKHAGWAVLAKVI